MVGSDRESREKLGEQLAHARQQAGFRQEDAARLLGINRVAVSYIETGERPVRLPLLERMAEIYRQPLKDLLAAREKSTDVADLIEKAAGGALPSVAREGVADFLAFLDDYAELLEDLGEDVGGRGVSRYQLVEGYTGVEDVRRKAEQVRDNLGLRLAPITDLRALLEAEGIVTYCAPLGADLTTTISGAFVNHDRLGFCILINSDTSPGRQVFTLAHEYGHVLFHSQKSMLVGCRSRQPVSLESFADRFAAEFLVPSDALRTVMEQLRLPRPIVEPEYVIHLQRYFNVSYQAMLVRLRQEHYVTAPTYDEIRKISPVSYAALLGYRLTTEEFGEKDARMLQRYPRRFIETVRKAYHRQVLTPGGAAELLRISLDEALEVLAPRAPVADVSELEEWDVVGG